MKKEKVIIGNYQFLRETGTIKIKEVKGVIVRIKYLRVVFNNPWLLLLHILFLYRDYKEVIYWNPNKGIIFDTQKYGNIGPAYRGEHSNMWFEVDRKNPIYKDFTDKFIHDYKLPIPFPGTHLERVTSKRLKKALDEIIFINKKS